jgi:hypothetical protein
MLRSVIGRIGSSSLAIRMAKDRQGTESSRRDRFQEENQSSSVGFTTQGSGDGPWLPHDAHDVTAATRWLGGIPLRGGAVRQTEFRMSDVYQADTPRICDAQPTSPTITAEDVRTLMLSRMQAAQAREHAAQAIAHAENMSVEDARRQVQQYEQQYRQAVDQAKQ